MKLLRGLIPGLAALALALTLASAAPPAVTPTAPAGVTGIALSARVDVAWQAVPGVDAYTVYRGTAPTAVTTRLTSATGITQTTFSDTTAVNGTTYYYAVRSVSGGVESASSLTIQSKPVLRACSSGNAVVLENCFPGNSGWKVLNPSPIGSGGIEGFATAQSVNRGESVDLKVNADDGATFRIEVYRSGYYGGAGARLFSVIKDVPAVRQPGCQTTASTGLIDCSNWPTSATLTTTTAWPTGVYLLRLVRTDTNTDFHILLVVRDDSRSADLTYGVSFSTFEAYNNYGGKSLYDFNSSGANTVGNSPRAVKVSFDRPFEQSRSGQRDWYTKDEFASVYWLEQSGYDTQYISNTDLESHAALALAHKAYISPAHDEYWSGGMRNAVTAARDAGVNLFFTGSNEVYWKVRFENGPNGGSNRVLVCYKTVQAGAADPVTPTTTWRDPSGPNQPENGLAGQMYVGDSDNTYFPLVVSAAQGSDRVYRYTGLDAQAPGTSTSLGSSLIGWEWDARSNNGFEPAGVKVLAGSPVVGNLIQNNGAFGTAGSATATMTKYTAASGALVVSTGTNHWNRGLALNVDAAGEPLVAIQQVTTNILADMGAQPVTPAGNITLDVAANRPAAPTGVTATSAGVDQISVSWNAVPGAAGYNIYRSTAPRDTGLPLGALANGSLVTGTSFTDTGLNSATDYFYIVTAVVNGVQSLSSNEASAITAASAGQPTRIDVAGTSDYTASTGVVFRTDAFFTGGLINRSSHAIAGTVDPQLYQSERYGSFTYSIPVVNGTYDVRLHFVELYFGTVVAGGAGKRVFSIDVGNTATSPDLPNVDIYATVGANTALVRTVSGVTVTNGVLDIHSVYGSADDPEIAAIEVIPRSIPPSVTDTTPAAGATGVGRLTRPQATFSRAMDPATITGTTFTLSKGATSVPGTVGYDAASKTATFSPTDTLDYNTTYTARLTTAVKADDGTALASAVTWSFTTQSPLPLSVTASFPADAATGVSTTVLPTATFSRSLDPTTMTSTSFVLKDSSGTVVPATVGYTENTRTATLTPSAGLSTSATYTATLTTAVKAVDGVALAAPVSVTFTTSAETPSAPTVTARTPANGATDVSIATSVTATFSRAMHGASVTASGFSLAGPSGTVAASVSYDSATQTATLVPSGGQLLAGATYTARLETTVHALDGSALAVPETWSFTTTPPPTIVSRSPADGAGYTARSTTVSVAFSRAMDASKLNASSFVLSGPGGAVASTVAYDAATKTATLTPTSILAGSTAYTAQVGSTVTAADGTPMTAASSWSFTTAGCPCNLLSPIVVPSLTGLSTQDGRTGSGPFTYEFGVKVVADEQMRLTAIRFYKSPGETGTHVGRVWASGGVLLGSQTFTGESASGWQQQALATPLTLQAGSAYVISVNANSLFVMSGGAFGTQVVSGPLRSVSDGLNGVYASTGGQFPAQSYNSSNYFVDLEAVPSPDPAPPTVTPVSPLSGATTVDRSSSVVGSFSRSMDPATVTSSTVTLTRDAGIAVPATVSYDDSTRRFTLVPSAQMAYTTPYTVHVSTGAMARDGMGIGASSGWSFTTADPVPVTVTDVVPAAGATDAGGSVHPRATFSKALKSATVNTTTFTLTGPSGGVAGTVAYDPTTFQATFTPTAALAPGQYTARLDASISATDDATLVGPYTWSFTVPSSVSAPSVTTTTPANGATGLLRSTTATAAFSRSMDPATLNSSTFTLVGPSGAVATTIGYDSATRVATLTPTALLTSNTTYTATVTTGAKSVDGTPLSAAATWSFTTASCPCTLFSPVLVPAVTGLSTEDGRFGAGPWTYELGVKITVTQAMQLAAIRFYKDAGETGTHVGRVWTASGAQIANVTFTNETASGWQQQALSSPIVLQANAVYVISVNANTRFVVTGGGLQTQIVNGPLRSVADGANGAYGATANTFPNQSYNSSNYFVDAVVQPDTAVPPTVTAQVPAAGATAVARTTPVTATFSRSMDATTITSSTFTVTGPGGAVAGAVTYDDTTNTARFVPSAPLAYSTTYTATLSAAVRAADGLALASPVSWTFTTAASVPPTVVTVTPANGALDVSSNATLRATFSKAMTAGTINGATFTVQRAGSAVAGTVTYDSAAQAAVFTPSAALVPGTYTALLDHSMAATDGSLLGSDYTWSFTVPSAPPPAPAVSSTSPVGGATAVDRSAHVQATFNRDLAPATVNSTTFDLRVGGSLVPATVSYDTATRTATLVPSAPLAATTLYTVEVGAGMQATDGTAMTPSSWTFTTKACPCSLFASTAAPSSTGNPTQDGRSGAGPFTYELGVKIGVDTPAQLTAVRYYKDPLETGTHVAHIWAADGTLLATVTFSAESSSGWQQQALATPLTLQPGQTYVVSVSYNAFFGLTGAGLASQVTNGPLHSIADGANGVYATSAGQFPTSSWNNGNYFVDVVVQ